MAHDVFISHSSKDKLVADAVCAHLEARGIRCWIAPRDICPGDSWSEAIIHAIKESRVMVLIFTGNANASRQVGREVQRAFERDVTVIPFRVEEVEPTEEFEYYISSVHWLDALTPPLESHIGKLIATVSAALGRPAESLDVPLGYSAPVPAPAAASPAVSAVASQPRRFSAPLVAGVAAAGAVGLLVVGAAVGRWTRSSSGASAQPPATLGKAASAAQPAPDVTEDGLLAGGDTPETSAPSPTPEPSVATASAPADVRAGVQEGYRRMEKAMATRDADAYAACLASDFTQTKEDGSVSSRETHLSMTRATFGLSEGIDAHFTVRRVQARGAKEAVAHVALHSTIRSSLMPGMAMDETDEDVWIRGTGGRWLLKKSKTLSLSE